MREKYGIMRAFRYTSHRAGTSPARFAAGAVGVPRGDSGAYIQRDAAHKKAPPERGIDFDSDDHLTNSTTSIIGAKKNNTKTHTATRIASRTQRPMLSPTVSAPLSSALMSRTPRSAGV